MSKTAARLALASALIGLGASAAAAYVHYQLVKNPSYLSFCDVSATVNCSQVYTSRYGSVAGIPVAIFGTIWFALASLLAWVGLTARAALRESVPAYLFAGSTIGLAAILYLGYASFAVLKLVCPLCLVTYAAVIGLFLVSGAATSLPMTSLPRRAVSDLRVLASSPVAVILSVLFVGGAGSALALFPRDVSAAAADPASTTAAAAPEATQAERSEFERWYTAQPRVPLIIPTEGAKVLVVKFNDYQCPPCRQSYLQYKSIFEKYEKEQPGAVRLVLRDYPLESECNANVSNGGIHPAACEAAVGVRLARQVGRAETLEEWLFANQSSMTPELVRQGVRDVAQVKDFDARYQSTLGLVRGDTALGKELGVRSTPTFFINGVKVEGMLPVPYFDQAIAYELARATAK